MENILENPILLLFLSFTIGAISHIIGLKMYWYRKFFNLNFLSDKNTKILGVLWLEWFILHTPLRLFNLELKIEGKPTLDQLKKLRAAMTAAELSHIIGFVCILPILMYYVVSGKSLLLIISMLVLNILFNGYTALTQQYNKRRLDKLIALMSA